MPYTSHGHWYGPGEPTEPRPRLVAKCGGPGLCGTCARETKPSHEAEPPESAEEPAEAFGAKLCSMCRHAANEHDVDPETGFRPCRSIGHPKGLACAECRRLTSPAHVDAVMAMREDDPLLKVAFGAYLATRAHVTDQLGESAPAFFTDVHESAVASALIEYGKAFAVLLDAEADGMSESWTRARGIADGLHRAARRLRGDQS